MNSVLLIGGTGFIGSNIARYFTEKGDSVSILTRGHVKQNIPYHTFYWDPSEKIIDAQLLKKQDIIINLSGAGIAEKRWTASRKKTLLDSRVNSTRLIIDTLIKNKIV